MLYPPTGDFLNDKKTFYGKAVTPDRDFLHFWRYGIAYDFVSNQASFLP